MPETLWHSGDNLDTHFRLCHLAGALGEESALVEKNAPLASGAVLLAYFLPQPSLNARVCL